MGAGVAAMGVWLMMGFTTSGAAGAGRDFFVALGVMAYIYVLLEGVLVTADCISQEKREGTLGLLFLTDLTGLDVVLGKMVARSANTAFCVLAAVPALGLSFLLGGVSGMDYARLVLALMNALFFSVAIGLVVSVFCWNERTAVGAAVGLVLLLGAVLPAAGWMLSNRFGAALHWWYLTPGPMGAVVSALGWGGAARGLTFGGAWLGTHCLAWLALAVGALFLPRVWQDRALQGSWWREWKMGGRARGAERGLMEVNPVTWLGERLGPARSLGWTAGLLVVLWVVGWMRYGAVLLQPPLFFGTAVMLHVALLVGGAVRAATGPVEDRRTGALELLLTTPLGERELVRGRMLAFKRGMAAPFCAVAAAHFTMMGIAFGSRGFWGGLWIAALLLALLAKLLTDVYAIGWVGLYHGWRDGAVGVAARRTIYQVMIGQYMVVLLAPAFFSVFGASAIRSIEVPVGVCLALALLLFSYLALCARAMSGLDDLRGLIGGRDNNVKC
jgi:hypothetical protein